MAESGNLDDPKNPGQKWPADKVSEADFFEYLRGKDGEDGEDGEDGKPGDPGMPGATVTIISGVPNVIAQYTQAEYSEYVRTTDGSVLYKVYDKFGNLAPGAEVSGMPSIDASKTYTADSNGEFLVPKEDLPSIQDVNSRWGNTASVKINGETLQSAKNTYVPNRVEMRLVLRQLETPGAWIKAQNYLRIDYAYQRKTNPEDNWQDLPTYLLPMPTSGFKFEAYLVSDKNDPTSTGAILKSCYCDLKTSSNVYYLYLSLARYMREEGNYLEDMNGQDEYWDGTDKYFTIKCTTPFYGVTCDWNGVAFLPPLQLAPTIKSIELGKASTAAQKTFDSSKVTFDFSKFDSSIVYEEDMIGSRDASGFETVTAKKWENFDTEKRFSLRFDYNVSGIGYWSINTDGNRASINNPVTNSLSIYLNCSITHRNLECIGKQWTIGSIKQGDGVDNYYVEKAKTSVPDIEVIYKP